uniref:Uncharacterized protein LOC123614602 n=1 Tax=Camelus bactrianus TaxID=9837 RepID=A0A9W3FUA2_CAMBA|nr:uncharacterized protein LOC123614602 [Camelus bactrianus]
MDSPRPSRAPTWKRQQGRCPQAGPTMTPCETSGYNTGPGRCSDPSCLVLQPEGRSSAAQPAPRPGLDAAAAQRPRESKVGAVPGRVVRGQPLPGPFLVHDQYRCRASPHP